MRELVSSCIIVLNEMSWDSLQQRAEAQQPGGNGNHNNAHPHARRDQNRGRASKPTPGSTPKAPKPKPSTPRAKHPSTHRHPQQEPQGGTRDSSSTSKADAGLAALAAAANYNNICFSNFQGPFANSMQADPTDTNFITLAGHVPATPSPQSHRPTNPHGDLLIA